MKDYLKEFEQALDAVVAPVLSDDWDSDIEGGDDDDADTGFSRESMIVQLGRVLDSQGNPKPVDSVTTDDGDHHDVTPQQAKVLRMMATTDKIKPDIRAQYTRDIQTTSGLEDFLKVDPQEMPKLFVKKYMGK